MSNHNRGTSDLEILAAINQHYSPAVGTADIADAVGVSRQAADNRLRKLHDDGLVKKYDVGSIVWYLSPAGKRYLRDMSGS